MAHGQYINTNTCIQCHDTVRQNDFCPTIPAAVWAQDDKHAKAFYLLHESDPARPEHGAAKRALVKQILGFELREAFTNERYLQLRDDPDPDTVRKVAVVKSCLRCHATWPKEADQQHVHSPPVSLALGVSCQACHGPGEKWDRPHALIAWRAVTPAAKSALGFTDCRSPLAKARLCASCHVGSISEEKFVKHEWYAAGHPPLPSFELASFEAHMPVHWKSLREKGDFMFRAAPPTDETGDIARDIEALKRGGIPPEAIKKSYLEANFPAAVAKGLDPTSDLAMTKDAISAGAVIYETYVRQIGDYASQAAENSAAWPELALYDCMACHHELRRRLPASATQRRHPPGRPPLADWPQVLAKLTARQAAGYDEAETASRWALIDKRLALLERATTSRPFGDPRVMRDAAETLADALAALAADAALTRYDKTAASAALFALTDPKFLPAQDYSSARQSAWAITAIAGELQIPAAPSFFQSRGSDGLSLRLPAGPRASVLDNLHRWLPAAANFDPAWFEAELSTVRAAIEAP
jgi:hypothetical protein